MNKIRIIICALLILNGTLKAAEASNGPDQKSVKKILVASESTKAAFQKKLNAKKQQRQPKQLKKKQQTRLHRTISAKAIAENPAALTESNAFSHKTPRQQQRLQRTVSKLAPAIQRHSDQQVENRAFTILCYAATGALAWQAYRMYKQLEAAPAHEKQILADSVTNRYQ